MKRLDEVVAPEVAAKIVAEIRATTEALFEMPQRGSSVEEIRDNLWEIYIMGGIEPRKAIGPALHVYHEIFEEIAERHGVGKNTQLRRRFLTQLAHALRDVSGYKKIEPSEYTPTGEELAKIKSALIPPDIAFIDLANQLVNLEEVEFYGDREREPGLTKALAAGLPAPNLRRLTLNGCTSAPLEGALENPAWLALDYLALYESATKRDHVAAALAHWPALETLAIRTEGRLGVAMLDIVATAAPRLVELALVNTQLAEEPIQKLLRDRPWPRLARLFVSGNKLSAATIKQLRKELPGVKIGT